MIKEKIKIKRIAVMLVGNFLIGIGIAFFKQALLGNDPSTALFASEFRLLSAQLLLKTAFSTGLISTSLQKRESVNTKTGKQYPPIVKNAN